MPEPPPGEPIAPTELLKVRLDYAWKWFDFHAKQRVTMFNFFLIGCGILANALVVAHKERFHVTEAALGFLGGVTSIGFICLDMRNRQLLCSAQDVLAKLEGEVLFPAGALGGGFVTRDRAASGWDGRGHWRAPASFVRHATWIRGIESLMALAFFAACYLATPLAFAPARDVSGGSPPASPPRRVAGP